MNISEARARRYRQIRVLEVLRVSQLGPNMRRITLGGEEIEGFGAGPNIKLLIPARGSDRPHWPMAGPDGRAIWPADPYRPVTRTYSVRRFDAGRGELDVDFVLHGDEGPASYWAGRAKPRDVLGVGGPGGRAVPPADFYLFVGDHSALPAISAAIEALPSDAIGHAFVEVSGREDELPVLSPSGLSITWLHRSNQPAGRTTLLQDAVCHLRWPRDRKVFAWIGCESAAVRSIRAHVRDERGLDRRSMMAIGYWRLGMSETQYNSELKNDRDTDYFLAMKEELDGANPTRG